MRTIGTTRSAQSIKASGHTCRINRPEHLTAPDTDASRASCSARHRSVQSLAQLFGPFLFTLTFAYFIGSTAPFKLPGAPFFLASALLLLAILIALRTLAGTRASK